MLAMFAMLIHRLLYFVKPSRVVKTHIRLRIILPFHYGLFSIFRVFSLTRKSFSIFREKKKKKKKK